jgi:hypothetical protein
VLPRSRFAQIATIVIVAIVIMGLVLSAIWFPISF